MYHAFKIRSIGGQGIMQWSICSDPFKSADGADCQIYLLRQWKGHNCCPLLKNQAANSTLNMSDVELEIRMEQHVSGTAFEYLNCRIYSVFFLHNFSNLIKHFPVLERSRTISAISCCSAFTFPLLSRRPDDNHVITRIQNMDQNYEYFRYILLCFGDS